MIQEEKDEDEKNYSQSKTYFKETVNFTSIIDKEKESFRKLKMKQVFFFNSNFYLLFKIIYTKY